MKHGGRIHARLQTAFFLLLFRIGRSVPIRRVPAYPELSHLLAGFTGDAMSLALVLLLLVFSALPAAQAESQRKDSVARLQQALSVVGTNPRLAESQMRDIDLPSAKAFRALLLFTEKIAAPGTPPAKRSAQLVDQLMNEAITQLQVEDQFALGGIDPSTRYHYTDLAMLLTQLRFITEADPAGIIAIPASIFRKYGEIAFEAFKPYWGSYRDSYLSVDYDRDDDVTNIKEVADFRDILEEMVGSPSDSCTGTIRYSYYRMRTLSLLGASIAPAMFVHKVRSWPPDGLADLNGFLEVWSNNELWNKVQLQRFNHAKATAAKALAAHYAERFGFSTAEAAKAAGNAIESIAEGYLDHYSRSDVWRRRQDPIYTVCSRRGLTKEALKEELLVDTLAASDLARALRLCILNDAPAELNQFAGGLIEESLKMNTLRVVFVRMDTNTDVFFDKVQELDTPALLRKLFRVTSAEQINRILHAWCEKRADNSIASAYVEEDELVLQACDLKHYRVRFDDFAGLAELPKEQRERFQIDEIGNHLFWPARNVSIDLDVVRYKVDDDFRHAKDMDALSDYKAFLGKAICKVMSQHRLTQTALKERGGPAERHLYRIGRGEQELTPTMIDRLSKAHNLPSQKYVEELIAACDEIAEEQAAAMCDE